MDDLAGLSERVVTVTGLIAEAAVLLDAPRPAPTPQDLPVPAPGGGNDRLVPPAGPATAAHAKTAFVLERAERLHAHTAQLPPETGVVTAPAGGGATRVFGAATGYTGGALRACRDAAGLAADGRAHEAWVRLGGAMTHLELLVQKLRARPAPVPVTTAQRPGSVRPGAEQPALWGPVGDPRP